MPRFAASTAIVVFTLGMLAVRATATDVPITARALSIIDSTASGGGGKISFTASDRAAGVTKGAGTDLATIEAGFSISWNTATGGFTVPPGARSSGAVAGWITNDARSAKFVNASAELGAPTGVRSLIVTNGKGVKLVARTVGDQAIDLAGASFPMFGIEAVLTITNAGERIRYCTLFPGAEIKLRTMSGGGRKLLAKHGVAHACPDSIMRLAPVPSLPALPTAPSLWFDGSNPSAVAAVVARTTNPQTSALYASVLARVNGSLGSLATASDDTRAAVAKGAGLLHVVGAVPPGGSGYASYRDVVVTALSGIGDRTAADSVDEFLAPPADILDVLHDAGRLQSMAEAYDLIRGSGVDPADDAAMRVRIANWADEYLLDWNLVGDPYGIYPGHRDNWAIKAGSAITTAALALPDHPNAAAWLAQGVAWINESLAAVVRSPGWYAEGAHYVNYSLNNLVSTAWHLRNAAATDWFDDLEPFVDMAMALRQPDGREPPFEEGVADTFPWDVLTAAYPSRAATMQWALDTSPGDFGSFDNQQFHTVTRFFVRALDVVAAAPVEAPTRFIDGETHAVILRSGWTNDALQVTGLTAIDTAANETFASRHHMENPLDVVVHGAGTLLLPTASGGPMVTTSPDRAYYLLPSSKNIPLVDGDAPYLLNPLAVTGGDAIDSRDSAGVTHRLLDAATTAVSDFASGVDVARTIAMVGESYVVVVDRFVGAAAHAYGVTWRGRGDGSLRAAAADHVAADYAWPTSAAPNAHLAVDTTSSTALTGALVGGFYAPSYGVEENLDPLSVGVAVSTFSPIAMASGAAATVTDGSIVDVVVAGAEGTLRSAGGLETDGRLALLRTVSGTITGMAGMRATRVNAGGSTAIEASVPATFAATLAPGTAVVTIGAGVTGGLRLTLTTLPGLNPLAAHVATFDGAPLPAGDLVDGGAVVTVTVPGSGVLVVSDS